MKRFLLAVAVLLGTLVVHDLIQPVEKELSTTAAIFVIERYRATVSPRIGGFVQCRFTPTCSVYGLAMVKKRGAVVGGAKALGRIIRCGPWTPLGTVDLPEGSGEAVISE